MGKAAHQHAERGKEYPAWRIGRLHGEAAHVEHACTDRQRGAARSSNYLGLCGASLRFPTGKTFDPEADMACWECSVIVFAADLA